MVWLLSAKQKHHIDIFWLRTCFPFGSEKGKNHWVRVETLWTSIMNVIRPFHSCHNWIYFAYAEAEKNLNYKGWMSKKDIGNVWKSVRFRFTIKVFISESKASEIEVQHQWIAQKCEFTFYWNFARIGTGAVHNLFQASSGQALQDGLQQRSIQYPYSRNGPRRQTVCWQRICGPLNVHKVLKIHQMFM